MFRSKQDAADVFRAIEKHLPDIARRAVLEHHGTELWHELRVQFRRIFRRGL